jgi:hypothetical protein
MAATQTSRRGKWASSEGIPRRANDARGTVVYLFDSSLEVCSVDSRTKESSMTSMSREKRSARCAFSTIIIVSCLSIVGCVSTSPQNGTSQIGFQAKESGGVPKRVLSKRDLDHVINAKLSRQETVKYLQNIAIEDYSIQDPNTNWSHASIGGAASKYSIYYLTYRQRYFILLLADIGDRYVDCLDSIIGAMPSSQYEIGMGPVEVNHDQLDSRVVVVFNKKWKENYSDDIIAAFRPNLETKQIEVFDYKYIRIFREE